MCTCIMGFVTEDVCGPFTYEYTRESLTPNFVKSALQCRCCTNFNSFVNSTVNLSSTFVTQVLTVAILSIAFEERMKYKVK